MTTKTEQTRVPTTDAASARFRDKNIVIVEGNPSASAPYHTLSKALTRLGRSVRLVRVARLGRREWMRELRGAEAVVLVHYQSVAPELLSQLATAVAMKVPIVRWWVGTDVLNVITREDVRRSAARFDRIVSTNVAVASHLVSELATAGIRAELVPSVLDPDLDAPELLPWTPDRRAVLTYMPESRKEFYGLAVMERVIVANPDLRFIIVADGSHSLAAHPNVESLGWVSDMSDVYARAGCILRITEHDGLPRMLMEGLLRGMYAIYSWPFAGCWQACTTEDVHAALARFRSVSSPNVEGRAAMLEVRGSRPDVRMSELISSATVPLGMRARALSLAIASRVAPRHFM